MSPVTQNSLPPHVAVVDDHGDIRELVGRYLEQHGFRVSALEGGAELRRLLEKGAPDLLVLDIMMPGEDGLALCRHAREVAPGTPVIFLTAMGEVADRIVGLEMGGDDYLTKPFNPRELLARIKAVLRRTGAQAQGGSRTCGGRVRFSGLTFDLDRREVASAKGVVTPLSTAESRLLRVFIEHRGEVLTRDQLLDLTAGRAASPFDRSIDSQVSRLRRKIERDAKAPELIKTEWGDGYCFYGKMEEGMES